MTKYTVFEDNKKSECPEKVLATWFGYNWRERVEQLNASSGNMVVLNRPVKQIKIYIN